MIENCKNFFCEDKVKPSLKKGSRFLFIGEAPGREEVRQNTVFCGASGKLLRKIIKESGIEDFSICNSVQCRPPLNRKPSLEEILNCISNLKEILDYISPKVIVCVGEIAGLAVKQIFKVEVKRFTLYKLEETLLTKIYHPAFFLYKRDDENLLKVKEWLVKLKHLSL